MRVHLGTDHAGLALKDEIVRWLRERGDEPVDHGAMSYDPDDDYPPYVMAAAEAAARDPDSVAIVLGGSGNGEAMAANKVPGVRAVLVWSVETARLGREHNNANVCSLGARMHDTDTALGFVDTFLSTPFSGDPRHVRRLAMIARYEVGGASPVESAGLSESG
jgi:ribose 5-phosphate isomerase B